MLDVMPSRTFVDPETMFTLAVPSGWQVDNSGQGGARVLLFHPRLEKGFRPNVNVVVHPLGGLSPEEYLTLTRLQFKQATGQAAIPRDEPAAFYPGGHVMEWVMGLDPWNLQICQLLVFGQASVFIVSATAPADSFGSYWVEFQQILASFRPPAGQGGTAGATTLDVPTPEFGNEE